MSVYIWALIHICMYSHHGSFECFHDTSIIPDPLIVLSIPDLMLLHLWCLHDRVVSHEHIPHVFKHWDCPWGFKDGSWYLPLMQQVSLVIESDEYKTAQVQEKLLTERRLLPSATHWARREVDPLGREVCVPSPFPFPPASFIISNSPFLSRKCSRLFSHTQASEQAALSRGSQKQLHPSCASVDSADCQEGGVNSVPQCVWVYVCYVVRSWL